MASQWIILAYFAIFIFSLVALFCGDWPIFEGTLLQRINHCCTGGAYVYTERVVGLVCGEPGRKALASLEYYCCERPNPVLQLFYFAILGGTYFAIMNTSFVYIPGHYVSSIHRYTGTWSVVVGLLLFLMTSFSDPGTITARNVSDHLSTYPYDGVLYEEKTCSTCRIPRPARSKHCSICGRCVARFDHHCGWTNNCIGENNVIYFLAFLFWHCCLCLYGAVILAAILAGEVKKRGIIRILTMYYGVNNTFRQLFPHVVQWLLAFHNTQLLIMLFLVVTWLLLAGFFSYHAYLVLTNTTTNETFKWENYKRWQVFLNQDKAELEQTNIPGRQSKEMIENDKSTHKCNMLRLFNIRRPRLPQQISLQRNNIYNRGFLKNVAEVLFPPSRRQWFNKSAANKLKIPNMKQ